ncbi:hypothetical protein [Streptomyces sp. RK62]|uniref:hypothetical protein n=1 Tax=Streptomyces sp. RK62 TaxID=2824893 RepID=UPI001B37959A|nr:hypothetical protein [Streptomyces sp. RK62]MBQ0999646.1 hypothetical protein [Streptomyces sp. RK62]
MRAAVEDEEVVATEGFEVRGDVELEEQRHPLTAAALGPVLAKVEEELAAHRVPRRFGQWFASDLELVRRQDLFPPRVAFDRRPSL